MINSIASAFKTTVLVSAIAVVPVATGFAQFGEDIDPEGLGQDVAQQRLQEISVTKFEESSLFNVSMSSDYGLTEFRRFEGSPDDKEPIEAEENVGFGDMGDSYVLGARADFYRRGASRITIEPTRPIAVPGLVKTMSVWVVGRNANHELYLLVEDIRGDLKEIRVGEMNFSGWRKMTVAIPPDIEQQDPRVSDRTGLRFRGLMIRPDMMQTYGNYYVYFDDL
ncbi:MAG: flagellar filament outer layer protein FlaA, partial [Spirochaetales bacterium]